MTDALIEQFEGYEVRITEQRVKPIEWVLLLAAAAQALERRWLAASVAHQVAYLAVQRGQLLGLAALHLAGVIKKTRESIEADPDRLLPHDLQWLDAAEKQGMNAVWGRMNLAP